MTLRNWGIAGALSGAAAGLVLGAPAAWLGQAAASASQGRLQLQSAEGSLWQGHARLVVTGGESSRAAVALPGLVHWQLQPHWGGVTLRLRADCCIEGDLPVELVPGLGSLTVRLPDVASRWPAALLAGLGAPWNTVAARGVLSLQPSGLSAEWSQGRWRWAGTAQLDALSISSPLSTLQPLGSYRLRLQADGGATPPRLQLETLEGSLLLSGTGQWSGTQWQFQGEARADPLAEEALGNLLNILGRREGARSVISLG